MKICKLCAVIIVLLTIDACAAEQRNQNILVKEATSESPIFPRLPSHGNITADDKPDQPESQGRIRFEDQSLERPVKFEDIPKEHGYTDIDKANPGSLLADISINNVERFDQNRRISSTGPGYDVESKHSKNKIKFEGNIDEREYSDEQEGDDKDNNPHTGASQVVFEDDGKADEDKFDYSYEAEIEVKTPDKPIKFENQDNESNTNRDSNRGPVAERVVFKDDSYQNQQKKKRKPRRKTRYETKPTNSAPILPNAPHPGLTYPGYSEVGYPSPGYPGPGDPNTVYSGYPTPGYPTPGYANPNYPSPYPSMVLPTPAYPGYSPYTSMYPPRNPGYVAYPPPGYQVSGAPRPSKRPTIYPNPGQGDPSGHIDTRYPSQEYAGSPAPGHPPSNAPQSGQPGSPYLGPEYPYYQSYPVPGYAPLYPSDANSQYPPQNQAQYRPPVYPGVHQQGYQPQGSQRPSRRPKSLTQRAVSAVAEALTSIALYDDQQCVPRILCEVAGGSMPSSPMLLKASASLQPLLTLLQAYNGVSSSPLFIFGHAAFTGVTAKGSPSACYRAYPQCPKDPEKLINYLNNHNGGFFRFFGQPEIPQQQHNLEQFYNYLSGQNGIPQQPQQQNYGFPRPSGYGLLPQNPYTYPYNYGQNYDNEQIRDRTAKDVDSEVEGRIQNKPGINVIEADSDLSSSESQNDGSKWSFPEEGSTKKKIKKQTKRPSQAERQERPFRGRKSLKFPDNRLDDRREIKMVRDYPRKDKNIFFPGVSQYQINTNYQTTTPVNPEEYYFDHKHNFYVKRPKALKTDDVVYVVRGNGDPNHPEIVRVKPGQTI